MSEGPEKEAVEREKQVEKEKRDKKREDRIHLVLSSLLVFMSYIFYSDYSSFRQQAPALNIKMRDLSDFWIICLVAVFINLVRRLFDVVLRAPLESRIIAANGANIPDLDLRREKCTRQVFDFFYYFGVYVYGRLIAYDIDYLPDCIGGAGNCDSLGKYWPRIPLFDKMRWYIIIQFAHHLHNLIYHMISMRNVGNYFEMITHHYAACVSLFYSYFTNWEDYAFIILICHDLSDGFLNFGKVLRDLGYGNSIAMYANFALLAFYWFYHRTIIIGSCYFYKTYEYYWWKSPFPQYENLWLSVRRGVNFIIFNIFIIWCLNILWWTQIVKIGINKFIKKKKWVSEHEGEIDPDKLNKTIGENGVNGVVNGSKSAKNGEGSKPKTE